MSVVSFGIQALFVFVALQPTSDRIVLRQGLSQWVSGSYGAALSADGRFVAFGSTARMLEADGNSIQDIYVLDLATRTLTLESVTYGEEPSNGSSLEPRLSGTGRYLVFHSWATNLTAGHDGNEQQDVFLRDRLTGITRRMSNAVAGGAANGKSGPAVISGDGRFVAFESTATNLVNDDDANGAGTDIYLTGIEGGHVVRVSVDAEGQQFRDSRAPSISTDGRLLAFAAWSRQTEPRFPSTPRPGPHVYVRDMKAAGAACVSCGRHGHDRGPFAFAPDLAADGRFVVFAVQVTAFRTDIAVHDRTASLTSVITRDANARSASPRVSADGRFVAFESWASDLPCNHHCSNDDADENLLPDVYVFDRDSRRFDRVSGSRGVWWAPSLTPVLDARGQTIAFFSRQPFGPEDVTVDFDLYVCFPLCR